MASNRLILEETYENFLPGCTEKNCSQREFPPPVPTFEQNFSIPIADPPALVNPSGSPGIHRKITIILAISSVLAACLFLLGYYAIIVQRRRRSSGRRRATSHLNPNPGGSEDDYDDSLEERNHHVWYIRTVGLDQSLIDKITICPYKKGDGFFDGTDCSVCLSEFDEGEFVRLLPKCSHAFHVSCIDTWLRSHVNCPLCRAPVDVSPPLTTATNNNNTNPVVVGSSTAGGELDFSSPSLTTITTTALSIQPQELGGSDSSSSSENPRPSQANWEGEYGGSGTGITILPPPTSVLDTVDLGRIGRQRWAARSSTQVINNGFQPVRRSISMDFSACRESEGPDNSSCSRFVMEKEKQWCGPKRGYDLGMVRSMSTNGDDGSKLFVSRIERGIRSNSNVLRR